MYSIISTQAGASGIIINVNIIKLTHNHLRHKSEQCETKTLLAMANDRVHTILN